MSKQFTAIAIMILAERDSLSLKDPLSKYFPYLPENLSVITIRQMLNHTSGLPNYNGTTNFYGLPDWDGRIQENTTPEEIIKMVTSGPLDFIPGEEWRYCNSGYTILARIIELVSGQSYENFLSEHIFAACGMSHTYLANDEQIIPNLVNGYRKEKGCILKAAYMSMSHTYGAGGILSTVDDLAHWMEALENNSIVDSGSKESCFHSGILNNGKATNYGFGWYIGDFLGKKTLSHGGGVYSYVSHGMYIPEEELYVVVLHNCVDAYTPHPTHAVGDLVAGIVLGLREKTVERTSIKLPDDQLVKYTGEYKFMESPGIRKISLIDHKVYYERPPRRSEDPWQKTEILPESKSRFFAEGRRSTITFHFNSLEEVTGFTVTQPFGRSVTTTKIK